MKLLLEYVRFKNFFSFGNDWTEIDLDKAPTTLILGKNGAGKSSAILDSISFALFNKPFRNITKPQITNTITQKNCMVELRFQANGYRFLVRRGQKPNIFEIYKDGELVAQPSDNRDYQTTFERTVLKVNHKTFCQVVMLGSAIFTPFMALPTPQRRAVIEDLLDLEIFSNMNVLLKARIVAIEDKISEIKIEKNLIEQRLRLTEEHIAEKKQSHAEYVNEKKEDIREQREQWSIAIAQRDSIEHRLNNLIPAIMNAESFANKRKKMVNIYTQLSAKIGQVRHQVKFFSENDSCPTCERSIDPAFKEEHLEPKLKTMVELDSAIEELTAEISKIDEELTTISKVHKEISTLQGEKKLLDVRISLCEKTIQELEKDLEEKVEKTGVDISKLDDVKTELLEVSERLSAASDERMTMGYVATLLKDTGIKAKIIKTFIPVINNLINKYLAALDFFVEFTLNESFEEKILSRYRDEFSYESFSEGEKMRLNIAVLFTWRALAKLRGSIDCNLVILDEVLDGPLDIDGLDECIKILTAMSGEENIMVISHKGDRLLERFSRAIHFEKVSNFSRMVA